MNLSYRCFLCALLALALPSCVYDPGMSYYQPAPVYSRPVVTYASPPPPPHYHQTQRSYYSPRYVPPAPVYSYSPSYSTGPSVQFYYSMPRGASYVRIGGNPCWFYNGHYYRRNPRGSGFVFFVP